MKIHGICFTHAPHKGKPIFCASGSYTAKRGLHIQQVESLDSLRDFELFLQRSGPWVTGVNFPIGQPWNFLKKMSLPDHWAGYIRSLARWDEAVFEKKVKSYIKKFKAGNGGSLRITDSLAHGQSPLMLTGESLGKNFFAGAKRLRDAGVSVPPCAVKKENRVVVEVCPELVARRFAYRYKETRKKSELQQAAEDARKSILSGLKSSEFEAEFGFTVELEGAVSLKSVEDSKGRYLDAVLAMIQAAWAYSNKRKNFGIPAFEHPIVQSEGWIVDPGLVNLMNINGREGKFELGQLIQKRSSTTDRQILNLITQVKRLSNIGRSLSGKLKLNTLLETIVSEARNLTHADGGTLYIVEGNFLAFKIVQNDSLNIRMGGTSGVDITFPPVEMKESNVSAYVALRKLTVNIPDVYNYQPFDFTGPKKFDEKTGYRTTSMLVVPLRNYDGIVIGVLQILNACDSKDKSKVIPFSSDFEGLVESLASQAAVAISNATLISDLQGANSQLIQTRNQALEASRSKSTFLANMSHELRTPMNAIIGYSEMLMEDAEDQGLDDIKEDLEKIHQSGKHLLGIINEILDLAKIEAGKMDVHIESVKSMDVVKEMTSTVMPMVNKNSNTLEVNCPDDIGVMQTDPVRLRQIVMNLLGNAAKFTEKGTVFLRVSRQVREGQTWIGFEIRDTGIGISKDQIDDLFVEFTQADPSSTRKFGGTGLGLTISRRLCQLLGGDIFVKSELDVGSTFTIFLPAKVTQKAFPRRRSSDHG